MVCSLDNQSTLFDKVQAEESKVLEIQNVITKISHYGNKQSQVSQHGPLLGVKVALDGILSAVQ
jgi:hypothetical protein